MVRNWCSNFLHNFMRNTGEVAATRPKTTIGACLALTTLLALGMLCFHHEKNPMKLWVPPDSSFAHDTDWLLNKTDKAYRLQQVIIDRDSGILEPDVISFIFHLARNVSHTTAPSGNRTLTWEDVCFKVPSLVGISTSMRPKRSDSSRFDDDFFRENDTTKMPSSDFDPSIELDSDVYCSVLESLPSACLTAGIAELWKEEDLHFLDSNQILRKLRGSKHSPVTGHPTDYEVTLSGISRDPLGYVTNARGLLLTWYVEVNFKNVEYSQTGNRVGTEILATVEALDWENAFLKTMQDAKVQAKLLGINFNYAASRSYGDVSSSEVLRDADKIVIGAAIMFVYTLIILSKWDPVEIRSSLATAAMCCVALSLICSVGLCSILGISYGPVHDSLPFLLMGLGIDDMFVVKACWENLSKEEKILPAVTKIGLTMSHAGVSILVTSFTDVIAFLVGSITVLPSLHSFCIYAAVAVSFLFLFSITFYVSAFALDLKRIEEGRNGLLPCLKHSLPRPTFEGGSFSRRIIQKLFSRFIFLRPVKIIIIIGTVVMAGFSFAALLRLEQRFDPNWFIPEKSYYSKFLDSLDNNYPDAGQDVVFMVGAVDYVKELSKIKLIVSEIHNESQIVKNFDSWTDQYEVFVNTHFGKNISTDILSEGEWELSLGKFLISPKGARFQRNFKFSEKFVCGKPAPKVTFSSVEFSYKKFSGPEEYLPAMHKLGDIVENKNISTGEKYASIWSRVYASWVTDEVIENEVERNIELALVCVMLCTWVLIMNLSICLWIFLCVLLTLVNVCGFLQYWGMTIDVVSCVGLELAVGLCVDYAAHVGHTFLLMQGTKEDRALKTVTSIGAAVLYGGGSTLLSLSMLSFSETYIFKSFFKIFLLVIIFGLFHGIVFLPVVLSVIGPNAHENIHNLKPKDEVVNMEQLDHLNPSNDKQ